MRSASHRTAAIIANGTPPPVPVIRAAVKSAGLIVCADGGANLARKLRIRPDVILGDMDSVLPAAKAYFRGVPFLLIPDQESTDLEKAIDFCIRRHIVSAHLIAVTGDRLDHTTGSLGCFKRFGARIALTISDTAGTVSMIRGSVTIAARRGERLSLIPLERCTGVTTRNLAYPLRNETLELGVREGISNEVTAGRVGISVRSGILLLYRFHSLRLRS